MIRQTKPARVEPLPQWQTIYCSLMLLLVVFFVMLISYSAIDKDKFLQIKNITQTLPNIVEVGARHESGDAIPQTIGDQSGHE